MKILSEKETPPMVDMECDFDEGEMEMLLKFADDNMPEEELLNIKLNWAFVEILKESIKSKGDVEK